ncbi:Uncharacterised protein [uncultured archaeon]|nr:Uncharacterised protein [uncultured archaeon]
MHKVIASVKDFDKDFPKTPKEGARKDALERYFAIHGVVKAIATEKEWPKLLYPDVRVLDSKIKELIEKKKIYSDKLSEWKKKHSSAANYHNVNQVKKFGQPLYWEHLAKTIVDSDYRKDANSVKLPVHLVADNKWKPMVKTFVHDIEYRKQLAETVNTSIIYKKDKKVARYADELQGFRMGAAGKQVKDLEETIADLNLTEKALRELQKWAKE